MGLFQSLYERQRHKAHRRFVKQFNCTEAQAALATMAMHPMGDVRPESRAWERDVRKESRFFSAYTLRTCRSAEDVEYHARKTVIGYMLCVTGLLDMNPDRYYVQRFGRAVGISDAELAERIRAGTLYELGRELRSEDLHLS